MITLLLTKTSLNQSEMHTRVAAHGVGRKGRVTKWLPHN